MDIFLSYAREDAQVAELLVRAFERRGWSVFWDRTIPAGKKWNDVLKSQLQKARCVVVLWSAHSVGSEWVFHEAGIALHRSMLVPVLLDPVLETDARLAGIFGAVQAVSWFNNPGNEEAKVDAVVRAVRARIGRPRKWIYRCVAAGVVALVAWNGVEWFEASRQSIDDAMRSRHNQGAMRSAGVKWISWGPYDAAENAREWELVRDAHSVDMIVTNAGQFPANFRPYLKTFFSRPDAHMRVIFSSVETPFYQQMLEMAGMFSVNEAARKADMGKVETATADLLSDVSDPRQIEFRYYDTQYRMPLILIDGRYCILTVRLPPDEPQESLRIEADDGGVPTAASGAASTFKPHMLAHIQQSCGAHFRKMWGQSTTRPVRYSGAASEPAAATANHGGALP